MTTCMIAGLALTSYAEGVSPADSQVKGILYRVSGKGSTAYILGSIHIGNQDMYPFGEAILKSMAQADAFVFECDNESQEAVMAARNLMYDQNGSLLEEKVSPECYEKLRQVCKIKGYSLASFDTLHPWAIFSQLSFDVAAGQMGVDSAKAAQKLGVDAHVKDFARHEDKEIHYLETVQEQLGELNGLSLALQNHMLEQTLDAILDPSTAKGMDADIGSWPILWKNGDARAFADSYWKGYNGDARPELVQEYHRSLVTDRNILMANRLAAMMEENPRTYFVTIGLLHVVLAGDSVVESLQEKGYQVECLSQPKEDAQ